MDEAITDAAQCLRLILNGSRELSSAVAESAPETTAALTEALALICEGLGATVTREWRCGLFRSVHRKSGRITSLQGRIDLLAAFGDGTRLAIEIDKEHKLWSLSKLKHMTSPGVEALWVRWNGPLTRKQGSVHVLNILHDSRDYRTQSERLADHEAALAAAASTAPRSELPDCGK